MTKTSGYSPDLTNQDTHKPFFLSLITVFQFPLMGHQDHKKVRVKPTCLTLLITDILFYTSWIVTFRDQEGMCSTASQVGRCFHAVSSIRHTENESGFSLMTFTLLLIQRSAADFVLNYRFKWFHYILLLTLTETLYKVWLSQSIRKNINFIHYQVIWSISLFMVY